MCVWGGGDSSDGQGRAVGPQVVLSSWEANGCWASQEIRRLLCNPKVQSPPLVHIILSQMNPHHTVPPHSNIILPSTPQIPNITPHVTLLWGLVRACVRQLEKGKGSVYV
jgi:hypothetical protein